MADVPVIQIQIDDTQYRAFEERVKQFRAEEAAAPGPWGEVAAHVESIRERFEQMAEAIAQQDAAADGVAAKTKKGADDAGAIAAAWGLMHVAGRRFSGSIAGATRDLVKWERLTGTFTALLGAGGLFGLDALASAAAARRRRSGGAGVSTGELAAFQTNFGRLGNTDSLLEGFNVAATDVTARQPLQSLGVDPRGKNAFQLFTEALPRIKDVVDRTDPRMLGPTLGAYHLDQLGFDEQTLRLIRRMTRAEIDDMLKGARGNVPQFDIPDDVGRRWQELETMLTRAGAQIQTSLADSLVNVAPGVEHVSESLVKLLDTMLSRPELKTWLHDAGTGLEAFAGKIGSKDALDVVRKAVDQFRMSRDDFGQLNNWFETHGTLLKRVLEAAIGARIGSIFGPAGAAAGALIGATGMAPTHFEDQPTPGLDRRQREGGAAGERNASPYNAPRLSLDQRNRERKAFGQKPFATQQEYDKAEPPGSGAGNQNVPAYDPKNVKGDTFLNDKSRRELSGVNKPLAEDLTEAARQSGITFQVNQGRRTQEEANANAARGIGVKDSQHLYGAAADIVLIDPATGQKSYDRALYQKFYEHFRKIADAHGHQNERWLGASGGRWSSDIVHFDQGIGYGQSHAADPYGRAAAPTQDDIKESRQEVYKSPANPFTHAAGGNDFEAYKKSLSPNVMRDFRASAGKDPKALDTILHSAYDGAVATGRWGHPNAKPPTPPVAVHVTDNTGSSASVTVHH